MRTSSARRFYRPAFEFQRGGPCIRGSAAHKPDLSISINRPSLQQQQIQLQQQQIILPNTNSHSMRTPRSSRQKPPITLDMFTIADDCGSLSFHNVTSLNLSSRKLNNVDNNSLKDLTSLLKLDVSDNNLKLEPFSCLEKLEDLDFSCNNLTNFSYDCIQDRNKAFQSLQKLNLNFNSIGKSLQHLSNIPNLKILLIAHNNLNCLPQNTNQFHNLEYLDLSNNNINTDSCFIALASMPNLKTLILDNNKISTIPKFHFGFEKINNISLKSNKIESSNDIISLADLENLREVDILNNPVNIYRKDIQILLSAYKSSNIKLVYSDEPPEKKRAPRRYANIVKVDADPLFVPNKELQKKFATIKNNDDKNPDFDSDGKMANCADDSVEQKSTQEKVDTDVFMTDLNLIPPTPLPAPPSDSGDDSNVEVRNIWREVPVINEEKRRLFTSGASIEKFNDAFKRLKYIVENPNILVNVATPAINDTQESQTSSLNNLPLEDNKNDIDFNLASPSYPRPRPNSTRVPYESKSAASQSNLNKSAYGTLKFDNDDQEGESGNSPRLRKSARANIPSKSYGGRRKKKIEPDLNQIDIDEKLNSNQQLSKGDIFNILEQMENKLSSAEGIINEKDMDGMNPVDKALDQTNFSTLHKQYESIRSEIVSTLRV